MDRKLNDREQVEQEELLELAPNADCPIYPSGKAYLPTPYLYKRRA